MNRPFDFDQFMERATDAIIAGAPDGKIIFWNAAAERIFGYKAAEAMGQSLDLIIPERYRERHWLGYRNAMETGQSRYGGELLRVPARHKDGRALSIAFTVTLLNSHAGPSDAIVAIVRDETARWREEQALRKRIADMDTESSCEENRR